MNKPNYLRIAGTGRSLPDRIVTNKELEATANTSDEWIQKNLGIRERRIVADGEASSDLGARAALKAIEYAEIDKNDIDLVLVCTATPDRKAPNTACLVKHNLGIRNFCPAFDISAVCSGFIYGMSICQNFIQSGAYKKILLVGADTFSKITDWNRRDCVYFGDGAGAVILEPSTYDNALFSSKIYSDCDYTDTFTVYPKDSTFTMDARGIYDMATRNLPEAIINILKDNDFTPDDISYLLPHQPSIRLLRTVAERLEIPFSKVKHNMEHYANTSAATIPILLDETNRKKELKRDDLIVFAGVGSGSAWGAGVYRWH